MYDGAMTWNNPSALTLYHGTVDLHAPAINARVDPSKGQLLRDFSRGFYTTTNFEQAATHARNLRHRLASQGAKQALVAVFTVNRDALSSLSSLTFLVPNNDYWDFIDWCRNGNASHTSTVYYDVVYGPVSSRWQSKAIHEGFDQISFHTVLAASVLQAPQWRTSR